MADTERVQQAMQWLRLRCGDGRYQRVRTLLGVTFQLEELLALERVEIAGISYQILVDQLLNSRVRQPANVHRAARSEMHEAFELPPWTRDVRTVDSGFVFLARY